MDVHAYIDTLPLLAARAMAGDEVSPTAPRAKVIAYLHDHPEVPAESLRIAEQARREARGPDPAVSPRH